MMSLRERFSDERGILRSRGSIRREILIQEQDVQGAHSLAKEACGDFRLERRARMEVRTPWIRCVQRDTSEICREGVSADRPSDERRLLTT